MLDNLNFMPIDSGSLTLLMHDHGINVRYLSHLSVLAEMPHVLELVVTEMLARTLKRLFNKQMTEITLNHRIEINYLNKLLKENKDRVSHIKNQVKL
jgi:hypothetical protein